VSKSTFQGYIYFAVLVCLFSVLSCSAIAQSEKQNPAKPDSAKKSIGLIIKVDPFWPLLGFLINEDEDFYSATLEKRISSHLSVQLTFTLNHFVNNINGVSYYDPNYTHNTYIFSPQLKYYFFNKGEQMGFYLGVFAQFWQEREVQSGNVLSYIHYTNTYGGGCMIGTQLYASSKISFEFLFGMGPQFYSITNRNQQLYPTNDSGLFLVGLANINIGYRF
jgi:uncharacterized protein DUF3575